MEKYVQILRELEVKLIDQAKDPKRELEEMASIIEVAKDVRSVIDRIHKPKYDWGAVN